MRSFFFKREMCESCPHSSPMLSHFYPWGEKVGYPSRSDAVPGLEGLVAEILIATFTVNSTKKPSWVIPVYTRTFQTSRCPTQKSFLTCWFQSFPIISNHFQSFPIISTKLDRFYFCRLNPVEIWCPGYLRLAPGTWYRPDAAKRARTRGTLQLQRLGPGGDGGAYQGMAAMTWKWDEYHDSIWFWLKMIKDIWNMKSGCDMSVRCSKFQYVFLL